MLLTGNNYCLYRKIKLPGRFTAFRNYHILQNAALTLLLCPLQADLFIVRPHPGSWVYQRSKGTELINVTKLSHSFPAFIVQAVSFI